MQDRESSGELALQSPDEKLSGPARIAGVSDKERLAWAMATVDLCLRRIDVLEQQVASIQLALPRGLP